MTNQLAADLRAAAQIQRARGRAVAVYENQYGEVCLLGAIRIAVLGTARTDVYMEAVDDDVERVDDCEFAVRDHLGVNSPTRWADEVSTSAEMSAAALEATAVMVETGGKSSTGANDA